MAGACATCQGQAQKTLAEVLPRDASGIAAILESRRVVFETMSGMARREEQIPITEATEFDVGSIAKTFTAVAVLRLAESGKLALDDPIGRFFHGVPADKQAITVAHLLKHTSGLVRYVSESDFEDMTRDEAIRRILIAPVRRPPGVAEEYADSNYIYLAAIVEVVTHQPFAEYIRASILDPLGLTRTMFYGDPRLSHLPVAIGYLGGTQKGDPRAWPLTWSILGAGGMLSDLGDLARWIDSVAGGQLLSEQFQREVLRPGLKRWTAGWEVQTEPFGTVVSKGGANDFGHSAAIAFVESTNVRAIVLLNSHSPSESALHHTVAKELLRAYFNKKSNP